MAFFGGDSIETTVSPDVDSSSRLRFVPVVSGAGVEGGLGVTAAAGGGAGELAAGVAEGPATGTCGGALALMEGLRFAAAFALGVPLTLGDFGVCGEAAR